MDLKGLFLAFLLFFFAGCQRSTHSLKDWMADSKKVKVLSTIAQIGDLVEEIGGEYVDHWTLIQGSLDPHSYELVKGDGEKLERADLIFCNGLGLEHGASLASWLHASKKTKAVGEEILQQSPQKILYRGKAIDPHIWMDISLWSQGVDVIAQNLAERDPEHAQIYQERAHQVKQRMEQTHWELYELAHRVPSEQRYLVTSHDAFHYFTRAYLAEEGEDHWEERFAAPEGLAPDGQLSTADIQRILQVLHAHHIRVLFPESNVSRDSIRKIVLSGLELGLSVRICEETLYGDAMEENLSYLEMMRHNVEVITRSLQQ
jgi:manganese/zinc/iron transport system substrate-binding protein